jgi:hypothetical protein
MKHFQPSSFPATPQAGFYDVTSCVGGIIRNTSLLLLMLWYAFAAAAAAVDTAKSVWHHPSVRSFVTALKTDLSDKSSPPLDLYRQPPPHFKDLEKAQREENRARRKLATELRQGKASDSSIKAVRQPSRII